MASITSISRSGSPPLIVFVCRSRHETRIELEAIEDNRLLFTRKLKIMHHIDRMFEMCCRIVQLIVHTSNLHFKRCQLTRNASRSKRLTAKRFNLLGASQYGRIGIERHRAA